MKERNNLNSEKNVIRKETTKSRSFKRGFMTKAAAIFIILLIINAVSNKHSGAIYYETRSGDTATLLRKQLIRMVNEEFKVKAKFSAKTEAYMEREHTITEGDVWVVAVKQSALQKILGQATIEAYCFKASTVKKTDPELMRPLSYFFSIHRE